MSIVSVPAGRVASLGLVLVVVLQVAWTGCSPEIRGPAPQTARTPAARESAGPAMTCLITWLGPQAAPLPAMQETSVEGWFAAFSHLNASPDTVLSREQCAVILAALARDHLSESQTCFAELVTKLVATLSEGQKTFLRHYHPQRLRVGYEPTERQAIQNLLSEHSATAWEQVIPPAMPVHYVPHDGPPYRRLARYFLTAFLDMETGPCRLEKQQAAIIQAYLKRALISLDRVMQARRAMEAVLSPVQRRSLAILNDRVQRRLHTSRSQAETNAMGLTHDELETYLTDWEARHSPESRHAALRPR